MIYVQIVYEQLFSQKSFHVVYINYFILAGIADEVMSYLRKIAIHAVVETVSYTHLNLPTSDLV